MEGKKRIGFSSEQDCLIASTVEPVRRNTSKLQHATERKEDLVTNLPS